jgi:hypothetical protein
MSDPTESSDDIIIHIPISDLGKKNENMKAKNVTGFADEGRNKNVTSFADEGRNKNVTGFADEGRTPDKDSCMSWRLDVRSGQNGLD